MDGGETLPWEQLGSRKLVPTKEGPGADFPAAPREEFHHHSCHWGLYYYSTVPKFFIIYIKIKKINGNLVKNS